MKLLIDAGNTRTKWACYNDSPSAFSEVLSVENVRWWNSGQTEGEVAAFVLALAGASEIWISNVAGQAWKARFEAVTISAKIHWVSATEQALGLQNGYQQPVQLGSDRWCSVLAAWLIYHHTALVVNAGTALTVDVLQVENDSKPRAVFAGGSIQPGLQLMWQSLQQHTAQLDQQFQNAVLPVAGFPRTTGEAMQQGCLHAMAGSILLNYQTLSQQSSKPPLLLLTGGDAPTLQSYLEQILSAQVIIVDNLVLRGLAYLAGSVSQ